MTVQSKLTYDYKSIYPTTRYQGSKLKIVDWLWSEVSSFDFDSMIDIMGGTGSVSYMFKQHGKQVTYNDILKFNAYIGTALLENDKVRLSKSDIEFLTNRHADVNYDDFIAHTFKNIFYTQVENRWLDTFVGNLKLFDNKYKTALALTSLFQSCIIKRPYNLFHRKNLYIRLADVERSFGNKASWDQKFDYWFSKFADEYNSCIFNNGKQNKVMNYDVMDIPKTCYDLVYFDPPYTSQKNTVDYLEYYHFLEGICIYLKYGSKTWEQQIDWNRKPLPLKHVKSPWNNKLELHAMFEKVISKFKNSTMIISWNADGVLSSKEMSNILKKYYEKVEVKSIEYKYVLSMKKSKELLFIAR